MTKTTPKRPEDQTSTREHMMKVAESLKVSCAPESAFHSDQMTVSKVERINDRELTSIYALLAYVSYNQNVRQETVQMVIEAEFGVDHVAKIRRKDYMRAIEFLVDLKMEEIMN